MMGRSQLLPYFFQVLGPGPAADPLAGPALRVGWPCTCKTCWSAQPCACSQKHHPQCGLYLQQMPYPC